MSETLVIPNSDAQLAALAPATAKDATVANIFVAFLIIGATSFGGGVVAYLRSNLVRKHGWLDDKTFVELLAIAQSLPGLNATNMAMLVGDRLRGAWGALAAIIGICLPGGLYMYAAGIIYRLHGDRPLVTAMLRGVVAASVGLVLATIVQLAQKSFTHASDFVLLVMTVVGVDLFHQSVPRVLIVAGLLATLWYRPRRTCKEPAFP